MCHPVSRIHTVLAYGPNKSLLTITNSLLDILTILELGTKMDLRAILVRKKIQLYNMHIFRIGTASDPIQQQKKR